jgi:tryptophan synthase alpha chain
MLGIYITAGYPNTETTIKALKVLDEANVDLIELGVPFSDPLADGPVIQRASHQALELGMNLDKIFELLKQARSSGVKSAPDKGLNNVILFSYYNPLFAYGWDKLIEQCLANQVRGVLIPDLPVDEAAILSQKFKDAGLDLVLLAAITSTAERLRRIYDLSSQFVYLVSRVGITGSSDDIAKLKVDENKEETMLINTMNKLKSFGDKPIGLGFGIDSREKVEAAYKLGAQIAIIGSKAVKILEEDDAGLTQFKSFINGLQVVRV